jgi:hypothetical protein
LRIWRLDSDFATDDADGLKELEITGIGDWIQICCPYHNHDQHPSSSMAGRNFRRATRSPPKDLLVCMEVESVSIRAQSS